MSSKPLYSSTHASSVSEIYDVITQFNLCKFFSWLTWAASTFPPFFPNVPRNPVSLEAARFLWFPFSAWCRCYCAIWNKWYFFSMKIELEVCQTEPRHNKTMFMRIWAGERFWSISLCFPLYIHYIHFNSSKSCFKLMLNGTHDFLCMPVKIWHLY